MTSEMFSYSCTAVDKISTDLACSMVHVEQLSCWWEIVAEFGHRIAAQKNSWTYVQNYEPSTCKGIKNCF